MQMAAIEAARNLLNIKDASSSEFGKTKSPVVGLMTEWSKENTVEKRQSNSDLGGTMRLGSYNAIISKGSKAREIYESDTIDERHRHRYEVNSNALSNLF